MRSPLAAPLLVSLLAAAGCDRRPEPGAAPDAAVLAVPRTEATPDAAVLVVPRTEASTTPPRTWPSDAPASNSGCTKHEECAMIVWDGPSPPDPCCDARVGYLPVNRSYLEWSERYRKAHCGGVTCEGAPFPGAEPIACARKARCVGGKCVDACKDPSYREDAPPPPRRPPPAR